MTLGEIWTTASYLVGALVFWLAARRRRLATEGMSYIALAGFCGGVFGAKLTEWMLASSALLWSQPGVALDPRSGGRTIIGGVICGWIAVEIAKSRLGIQRSTGDLFALALPAGEAVGRIGCYFNGCCFGTVCEAPWAIYQHGAWRHPAQFYAAFLAATIFVVLWSLRERWWHEGDGFKAFLLLWGSSRFLVEFFRQRDLAWGGLSTAQWVGLELAVSSGIMLWLSWRRANTAAALHAGSDGPELSRGI